MSFGKDDPRIHRGRGIEFMGIIASPVRDRCPLDAILWVSTVNG